MEPRERLRSGDLVEISGAIAAAMIAHAEGLDRLDRQGSTDGDTGANLVWTATAVAESLQSGRAPSTPTEWADGVRAALAGDGAGRSGRRLAGFLLGMAAVASGRDALDATDLALAYEAGAEGVEEIASPTDGSPMAAVAAAAARGALAAADAGADLAAVSVAAADAALDELENGAVPAEIRDEGVVDAGSAGLCVLFDVIVAHVHRGDPLDVVGVDADAVRAAARRDDPLYTFVCTLEGERAAVGAVEGVLSSLSAPLEVTAQAGGGVRIRAATDELGALIEAVCSFGRPSRIVVEDRRSRG